MCNDANNVFTKNKKCLLLGMTNVITAYLGQCTVRVLNLLEGKLAAGVPSGFIQLHCEARTAPSISLIRFRTRITGNKRGSFIAQKPYI